MDEIRRSENPPPERLPVHEGLAFGAVALAMVGCCGLPLLIALASSLAIGTLLGVGGGVLAAIGLVAIVVARTRARRRACAARPPERESVLGTRR